MKKKLNTLKLLASIASTVDSLLDEVVNEDKQSSTTTSTTKVGFEKFKAKAQEHHKQIKDQVSTLVSNVKENDEVNELMKMVRELKDTISNNNKVVAEVDEEDVDTESVYQLRVRWDNLSRDDYFKVFTELLRMSDDDVARIYNEMNNKGYAVVMSSNRYEPLERVKKSCDSYWKAMYSDYESVFSVVYIPNEKETNNDTIYHLISNCVRSKEELHRGQAINVSVTKDSMLADGYNPDYAEEAFMYLKKLFGINLSTTKLYITVLSEIANMPSHYVVVVNGTIFTGVHGTGFYVEDLEDFD